MSYRRLADLTGKIIAAEGYELHRQWIDRDDLPFDADVRDRIRGGKGAVGGQLHSGLADRTGEGSAARSTGCCVTSMPC